MVKHRKKNCISLLAIASIISILPSVSHAQSANKNRDEEVVVTAQRREQRLKDVPVSASVVSGTALSQRNIQSLQDLSNSTPNIKIAAAPAADQINIRGIGSGLNSGFEQSVGTFVDGVYRGRSRAVRAALFDIDRVEVLKGPQTTFFGNNAIAGALNISTKKPGNTFSYNASALYAPDDGEYSYEGGVTAPLTDTLSVRAALRFSGMDGYIHNSVTNTDGPNSDDFVGRISFAWTPTENFRSDLRYDYGRLDQEGFFNSEVTNCPSVPPAPTGAPVGGCVNYLNYAGANADASINYVTQQNQNRFNYEFNEIALTNSLDIGNFTLTSITSYFEHDVYSLTQLMPLPQSGVGGIKALQPFAYPESYNQFSQELRLQSPKDKALEYMVGIYYSEASLDTTQYAAFYNRGWGAFAPSGSMAGTTPITATSPIAGRLIFQQDDKTISAFGAATWHATDRLKLNLGLRYTEVEKKAYRKNDLGIAGIEPGANNFVPMDNAAQVAIRAQLGGSAANFARPSRTDTKFMPSLSIQYDLTPEIMAYAGFAQGFKAGGFSASSGADIFGSENVDSYEMGLKGTAFDRKLFFSISAFKSDYNDLQESSNVPQPIGSTINVVANVANARASGIELSTNYKFNSFVSLNLDMAWLDAKYLNYTNAPCTAFQTALAPPGTCYQDLSGKRKAFAPLYSGNIGLSIKYPIGDNEIRFDPSLSFTGGYYQQATYDPLMYQDDYMKLDARLAYGPSSRNWEVALIGRNLTDELTTSFRNNLPSATGTIWAIADRPRSIAIQISIKN